MTYSYNIKVASDIHFGRGDDERLYRELSLFKEDCRNHKTDAIVITGDIWDRIMRMNETASMLGMMFVNELNDISLDLEIPLRLIKGTKTHDFNQLNLFKTLASKNPRFLIIETLTEEELLPGLKTLYIPEEYVDEDYYDEVFNKKYDICFGHGTFDFAGYNNDSNVKGRGTKNAPTFKASKFSKMIRLTVFGHIHNSCCSKRVYYVGSYSRRNFAEFPDRFWMRINITDTDEKVEYMKNNLAPTYLTLNIDELEMELSEKLVFIEDMRQEYDHLKLVTKTKNNEELSVLKSVIKDTGTKIEVKTKVESKKIDEKYAFVLDDTIPLDEKIKRFIKIKTDKDIDLEFIRNDIK